jgi:hypothetical protein
MTHINNLAAIVKNGGLLCKNELTRTNSSFEDIANSDVQDKRAKVIVRLKPGGTLHDYVPFYFSGQTPMLLVNKQRQNDIIFLVSNTDTILESNIPFMFTDRHAVIQYANFYNDLNDLNKVDWKTIKNKYWGESVDSKEKKQAEFLVHKSLPFTHIYGIGVLNEDTIKSTTSILRNSQHQPTIKVKKEWYFL